MSASKKVIFIGSTSRSGSTILDMMLGNGPGLFSLGEVNAQFRPYRKHHYNSLCACGDAFCKIRRSFKKIKEKDLYDHVFDTLDAHVIIDSSKELTWILDQYQYLSKRKDIDVKILLIYKDPVSLAHSYFKRGQPLMFFKKQFQYYSNFVETRLPFVTVEYESLVADPKGVLSKLCDYLGISYFEGKEEYWNKEMHHFFGSNSVIQTYESSSPRISDHVEYREDFLPHIPTIKEEVAKSKELKNISAVLEAKKISGMDGKWPENGKHPVRKPLWYYKRKLKALFRKRFPTEYQERVLSA